MSQFKYPIPSKLFIHGKYVESKGTTRLTLTSAVDNSLITNDLHAANPADVDAAVESSLEAFEDWKKTRAEVRRQLMLKYADLIAANIDHVGYLDTIVSGKPISVSGTWEAGCVVELLRYYAGYTEKFNGEFADLNEGVIRITRHEPLGVCAAISPFNGPLVCFGMAMAPALATGNTMIAKCSEYNPLATMYLGELAIEAGIPPGVVNILVGATETGAALSSHMKIRQISFTGSLAVGRKVSVAAAMSNLKRVILELGGKSPLIVFPDADMDEAVAGGMQFTFLNGQGCSLATRIYVHSSIATEYVSRMKSAADAYTKTLGADPLNASTASSPIYHPAQYKSVLSFIERSKADAELLTGGKKWGDKGLYIEPTIFVNPKPGAHVLTEEAFGPITVVDTFDTEEEVVAKANDTEYALGGYLYTKDAERIFRMTTSLETGNIAVNGAMPWHPHSPFGGHKASGYGCQNGEEVLHHFTQPKTVAIKLS